MKTVRILAGLSAAAAVLFGLYAFFIAGSPAPEPGPHLAEVFPGALGYDKAEGGPFPYFEARGPQGRAGVLFVTSELAPEVRGYSGRVPVLVGMFPDGRLTGIKILANDETPSYLARVDRPAFTDGFRGKGAGDPFVLDSDIDGVTRATVTAGAVASGVREASRRAATGIFGLAMPSAADGPPGFVKDPAFYLILILIAASVALYLRGRAGRDVRAPRWAVLAGSLAVIGVYRAMPVSLGNYFNMAALRLPGISGMEWYLLVAGALVLAVLWGRLYCGYLCPFGALQELIAKLPLPKLEPGAERDSRARGIKYALLWAVTVAAFTTGLIEIGSFEPYTTLFSGQGDALAWGLVGATIGAGMLVPRFWCRYLCPVGALLGLVSRHPVFRQRRFDGCTGCGACAPVCAMGNRADGEAGYRRSECIGCGACIAVCQQRRAQAKP